MSGIQATRSPAGRGLRPLGRVNPAFLVLLVLLIAVCAMSPLFRRAERRSVS